MEWEGWCNRDGMAGAMEWMGELVQRESCDGVDSQHSGMGRLVQRNGMGGLVQRNGMDSQYNEIGQMLQQWLMQRDTGY